MRTLYLTGRHSRGAVLLTGVRSLACSPLARWNSRQARTLARLARLYRVELSPDTVAQLAGRYAIRHASERPQSPVTWSDIEPGAAPLPFWSYPPEREV